MCSAQGPIEFEALRNNVIVECEKAEDNLHSRYCIFVNLLQRFAFTMYEIFD